MAMITFDPTKKTKDDLYKSMPGLMNKAKSFRDSIYERAATLSKSMAEKKIWKMPSRELKVSAAAKKEIATSQERLGPEGRNKAYGNQIASFQRAMTKPNITKKVEEIPQEKAKKNTVNFQAEPTATSQPKAAKSQWREQKNGIQFSADGNEYRKINARGQMDYYKRDRNGDFAFNHEKSSALRAEKIKADRQKAKEFFAEKSTEKIQKNPMEFDSQRELSKLSDDRLKRLDVLARELGESKGRTIILSAKKSFGNDKPAPSAEQTRGDRADQAQKEVAKEHKIVAGQEKSKPTFESKEIPQKSPQNQEKKIGEGRTASQQADNSREKNVMNLAPKQKDQDKEKEDRSPTIDRSPGMSR